MWCIICRWRHEEGRLATMIVFGSSVCNVHGRELADRTAAGESVRKILAEVVA